MTRNLIASRLWTCSRSIARDTLETSTSPRSRTADPCLNGELSVRVRNWRGLSSSSELLLRRNRLRIEPGDAGKHDHVPRRASQNHTFSIADLLAHSQFVRDVSQIFSRCSRRQARAGDYGSKNRRSEMKQLLSAFSTKSGLEETSTLSSPTYTVYLFRM